MKTIIFIVLSSLSLLWIENSNACQVGVMTQYQKNLLVAYAASEMNVDLSKATFIRTSEYSHQFSGAPDGNSCPRIMENQARVEVTYKPNILTTCSFSVMVHKRELIDFTTPVTEMPLVITLESPTSSCTRINVLPRPDPRIPDPRF